MGIFAVAGHNTSVGVDTAAVIVLTSQRSIPKVLIQDLARRLPLGQLLSETDNPGSVEWLTGKPGMPAELPRVVEALAQLRGMDPAELRETIRANFLRMIEGDPHMAGVRERILI